MPNLPKTTPQHLLIGQQGEELASKLYLDKGFEILHRNFRSGKAEIDLIVKKGNLIVFVEVKTRTNINFGMPEGDVTRRQAKMIVDAAEQYTYTIDWQHNIRFDIIAVVITKDIVQIEHFEDAFY
jgi:putative endonuclease